MAREQTIPFALWVSAAVLAHMSWSGGAHLVAKLVHETVEVRWFAESVRGEVAPEETFEVSLVEATPQEGEEGLLEPPEVEAIPAEAEPEEPEPEKPEILSAPPEEPDKPPPPAAATASIHIVPATPEPPKPMEFKTDKRIAVKQHVKDKDQKDNPNARFVGDEANTVEEESVARITSHDTDDPNPTPGGQHVGPTKDPGNADQTHIGQSDDSPGDPDRAPGESADDNVAVREEAKAAPTVTATAAPRPPSGGSRPAPRPAPVPKPAATPPDLTPQGPEVIATPRGGYSLDPRRKKVKPAASARRVVRRPRIRPNLGLGAGPNERGVQLNLNQKDVVAAVGPAEIKRQRAADGARRRSKHRGSSYGSTFERWRPAIENYVSSVRAGNQTALNTARVPFATYLVSIHNRLHPVFADTFLSSLDSRPPSDAINSYKLFARLEIVLDRNDGRVVKMGVVKTSGITSFDVGALDSVYRAQPFGKAPDAIISKDGNVYLHWEFHRNPIYACSTMNARPFMLNAPPPIKPPKAPPRKPRPPSDPRERGVPPSSPPAREGGRYGRGPLPHEPDPTG